MARTFEEWMEEDFLLPDEFYDWMIDLDSQFHKTFSDQFEEDDPNTW